MIGDILLPEIIVVY